MQTTKAGKVSAPSEDKRTFSFSCQACKIKKIKCSRTFPCDHCVKLKIDCFPQSRKSKSERLTGVSRGRPRLADSVSAHGTRFNDRLDVYLRNLTDLVKNSTAARDSRIADFIKCHLRRRQMRKRFIQACLRAYDGQPDSKQYLNDWFGTEVPLHLLTGGESHRLAIVAGHSFNVEKDLEKVRRGCEGDKDALYEVLRLVGFTDPQAFLGEEKPRSEFRESLEEDRSWLSAEMKALLEPTAFPGAAVMVEFQVSGHQSYSVNKEFTSKFYTEMEMLACGPGPGFPWGSRKIFDVPDRLDLICHELTEMLAQRRDVTVPMEYNELVRLLDRHGNTCSTHYMRRYFWCQEGGEKACTIFILYPINADSKHLRREETVKAKPKPSKKAKSNASKLTTDPSSGAGIQQSAGDPAKTNDSVSVTAQDPAVMLSVGSNETQVLPVTQLPAIVEVNTHGVALEAVGIDLAGTGGSQDESVTDDAFEQLLGMFLDGADDDLLHTILSDEP